MQPSLARTLWQLLEPYHAVVYFEPQAKPIYESIGLKGGWMGYFASRSAALGAVPPEVVIATFYNFHPNMVRRALPDAWSFSTPERVLEARYRVVDLALRRLLGDEIRSESVGTAAETARGAAGACSLPGRPLFAAHAALEWPIEPHLALWHAATLLREFRGDGHVLVLASERIDGCEANVLAAVAGSVTAEEQRLARGWSNEEWRQASQRLADRGLVDGGGGLTRKGADLRNHIETRTDELALPPFEAVGETACNRLEHALRELFSSIAEGGGVRYPNPIGLTKPPDRVQP